MTISEKAKDFAREHRCPTNELELQWMYESIAQDQLKIDIKKACSRACELCNEDTWECPRNCYKLKELQKAMGE